MNGREPGLLIQAPAPGANLLVRGARALDPGEGIDGVLDVLVRDGRIPRDAEVLVFNTGSGASYRF